MTKLRAIKLLMENGIIEDCKEGIVIVKQADGMVLETVNILPVEQIAFTAIALNELLNEYFSDEEDETFNMMQTMLRALISSLLNTNNPTKGEVVQ